MELTILSSLFTAVGQAIDNAGVDSRALFGEAGLDVQLLDVPGSRYPVEAMQRMWPLAIAATGDPCLGLRAARYIRPTNAHALGLACLASSTLRDALQRIIRHEKMVSTALSMTLDTAPDQACLTAALQPRAATALRHGLSPNAVDVLFGMIVRLCQALSGRDFAPQRVERRCSATDRASRHARFFRCPIVFDAELDRLWFDRNRLEARLPTANAELADANSAIAERYLADLQATPCATRVHEILLRLLPSGPVTQQMVADEMNMSISTLQRHLKGDNTSFRALVDDTRRALAVGYVRDRRHSLAEVAFLLGFADQSSFTKAFKRWTGTAPGSFRR